MRRGVGVWELLVFGLTLAVVGCGAAEAASVALTWNAPTTNVDGSSLSDLAGYRVYLATTSPSCPGPSFFTVPSSTTAPSSGQTVSSRVTSLAVGTTYFVRISAVDTSGNESSCSPAASGVAQADFTVAPSGSIAFGNLLVGALLDRTFTVQNTSAATISGSASVGAPFRIVSGASFTLAPGASQTVTVRFQPTALGTFATNVAFTAGSDTISRGVSGSSGSGSSATLSVSKSGTGTGTVTSTPAGIACGTDCTESLAAGTQMTLTAAAASGSTFAGWSGGGCSGTASCVTTVSAATTVTATFNTSATPPPSSSPPPMPASVSATQLSADASGVTFTVSWSAVTGATSYRYAAAFSDGTSLKQGSVTGLLSFQLLMPYHSSGKATSGFVCIRSVNAAGQQSTDQACIGFTVPAPPPPAPAPVASSLSPSTASAGSAGLTLTVNGSGFVASSVVRWNSAARTTTFVSATQLRAAISTSDLASAGSIQVSVATPAPGGGTSGSLSFVVTAATPSTPPPAPGNPTVQQVAADGTGATFAISWSAASGATSYSYVAAFSDGSSAQQGTVTGTSFQLKMPYHASGAAFGAFVCVRSVNAAGQPSADQACNALQVPARP
jgi:Divergent InlB B-repeat domain